MPCDIESGRLEACKDSISGLDSIFFINYGDITAVTYITNDVIDSVTGVSNLYKYELKGTNTFDQNITSSRENGTTFVEQTLAIQLKKQDAQTHKTVKMISYGRPHVVIKTKSGQYALAGLNFGLDLTTAAVSSGTAMGDFSGYSLTLIGNEELLANFIDAADDAALALLFDGATIVLD